MKKSKNKVIAQTYLGNVQADEALLERVKQIQESGQCLEVEVERSDRTKGRILAQAVSGQSVGIVKDRTWQLREGDIFETAQGDWVVVHLEAQQLMALRFSQAANSQSSTNQATALVQLGYMLGNQHWPTTVEGEVVYVEQVAAQAVMEKMVREMAIALGIEDLQITFESKLAEAAVEFQKSHHIHSGETHSEHTHTGHHH